MTRIEILEQIKKLPAAERIKVVEEALDLVRQEISKLNRKKRNPQRKHPLKIAAKELLHDYQPGGELTEFTLLDSENFHA